MKLSPRARAKLGALTEAHRKWDHVRALVEQAAGRKSGGNALGGRDRGVGEMVKSIGRAATDVSELLAANGFAQIAEDVRELHMLARRGKSIPRSALRRMQEVVANVTHALQAAEATLVRDDIADARR